MAAESDTSLGKSFTPTDLPTNLFGYQLEEVDAKKPAVVKVGGTVLEVKLPVFVYFPAELHARKEALKDLHRLYEQLVELAGRPAPTAADFEKVLVALDQAMTKLEANPAPHVSNSDPEARTGGAAPGKAN